MMGGGGGGACRACVGSGVPIISTMHVVGVGQNESGGVKQCTGHFYSFISFI